MFVFLFGFSFSVSESEFVMFLSGRVCFTHKLSEVALVTLGKSYVVSTAILKVSTATLKSSEVALVTDVTAFVTLVELAGRVACVNT